MVKPKQIISISFKKGLHLKKKTSLLLDSFYIKLRTCEVKPWLLKTMSETDLFTCERVT